jgi:predicted transcriptional regulator of viral defense system
MRQLDAFQTLQRSKKSLFTTADLKKLFDVKEDNTLYKQIERLTAAGVLRRAMKGFYFLALDRPTDFEIANALYMPSYVSMESALNYYGILIQTPQQIISVTPRMTKRIHAAQREFNYLHLDQKYYTSYHRDQGFLIATPEKALIDALFFSSIGRGSLSVEELMLDVVDSKKLHALAKNIANRAFQKFFASLKL